jgi:hypothetical protein
MCHWAKNTATLLYRMNYQHVGAANPPKGGYMITISSICFGTTIQCRLVRDRSNVIKHSFYSGLHHIYIYYLSRDRVAR